ncbi:uncharacterized protein EDB91DRAFT_1178109 [Suillus paluster]|uniref:uncharacterized protein n=1 Tax=Suillus paluster TaxID=48578 RepID=UPI001B85EDD7|nr:uncharacterized protein EDB91DRAFT_1178109 [Suillus paluster]KAG1720348.1 hypothetical protein EDB91DRAFT_1178109 [Suillus paluster]
MFTSRSIMFALLSFLASANACVKCPAKFNVEHDDVATYVSERTIPQYPGGPVILCSYYSAKLYGGDLVHCAYYTSNSQFGGGFDSCPTRATVTDHC